METKYPLKIQDSRLVTPAEAQGQKDSVLSGAGFGQASRSVQDMGRVDRRETVDTDRVELHG